MTTTDKKLVETSDSTPRTIGYIIIFLVFGIFGGWAVIAPLDSAALAPGKVIVKGKRKTVQHLEGGIIEKILVSDGQTVQQGEALLILDNTQPSAELQILQGQLVAVKTLEARLVAERDGNDKVSYPIDLDLKGEQVTAAIESENQQFYVRKQALDGETDLLNKRHGQLKAQINGLQSLIKSKRQLLKSFKEEINDNLALLKEGFVDKRQLREMQRRRESLRGEVAEHNSSIAALNIQQGETELQALQLTKSFRAQVVNQLAEVQAKVFDLKERINATSDRVARTKIIAPVGGMILGLTVHTEGGIISSGTPILDIVPITRELIIEAEVSPTDIDRVAIGLPVDIRFSSFKSSITPVIKGNVSKISADILVNQQTGIPFYLAIISISDEGLKALDTLQLIPGMPAEVLINTGERTLMDYLIQPATDALARSLIED
jgi:epimerase transport system membrane fusion protein